MPHRKPPLSMVVTGIVAGVGPGWVCALLLAACTQLADEVPEPDRVNDRVNDAASERPNDGANDGANDASGDASADASPGSPCPPEMVALPGACMDRYEAPGIAGQKPLAMQTAVDAESFCATRGKRLCTEAEWLRACQGTTARPYPYGTTYKRGTCNDDKTWRSPDWTVLGTWPSAAAKAEAERLYQGDPSGSRPGCASEEGVFDLTGNVAEWVRRSLPNRTNYDHVMKGCYWAGCYGGSPPSCAFVNPAHPGTFRTYEAGFRCCRTR